MSKKFRRLLSSSHTSDYHKAWLLAKKEDLIKEEDTSVIFVDFDILKSRLNHLIKVFPGHTLHAIPIKTHPLKKTLETIGSLGFGLEAASFEELSLGKAAGIPTERLVFDSPVKTRQEIQACNAHFPGCLININDLSELELFSEEVHCRIGLRINPLVQTSNQALYDVSSRSSKFGEPISNRSEIIQAFLDYPFLEGLHIHTGSDIPEMEANAPIINRIYLLAKEIEAKRLQHNIDGKITYIDIGGGVSTPIDGRPIPGLESYVEAILNETPNLFNEYEIITEFGRFTFAHCAWLVSNIAQIREFDGHKKTVLIHAGADLFVREVYSNKAPIHRLFVLDELKGIKQENSEYCDIGGPLCFAGDYVEKDIQMPQISLDNKIIVADIGANTMSLWSRHCSRSFPKVIYYSSGSNSIIDVKSRENIEDIINFWS